MFIRFLILFFLSFFSCNKKEEKKQEISYPIKKTAATAKDMPIFIDTIGHVKALSTIDIKSRIEGKLTDVLFDEGEEVSENDLLFIIDPRPLEAKLAKAEATLEENIANLKMAEDKLARYSALVPNEYISKLEYEQLQSNVAKYKALIDQNKADITEAKVQLSYCYIYSPITGKTGILQIDKGNLVPKDHDTPLITIQKIEPIYVLFSIAEKNLPLVQKYSADHILKVRVSFDDLEKTFIEGDLDLIDNAVNMKTGMIKLRGVFKNEDRSLWPGKYVKARLILTIRKDSIVIPFQAIQLTTEGPVVFVVKKDQTVEKRSVEIGQRKDETIIILKGLQKGEEIVTEGQLNLINGSKVFVKEEK